MFLVAIIKRFDELFHLDSIRINCSQSVIKVHQVLIMSNRLKTKASTEKKSGDQLGSDVGAPTFDQTLFTFRRYYFWLLMTQKKRKSQALAFLSRP